MSVASRGGPRLLLRPCGLTRSPCSSVLRCGPRWHRVPVRHGRGQRMAAHYPIFQVTLLRFVCGTVVAAGVVVAMRPGWPSRETALANAARSSSPFYPRRPFPTLSGNCRSRRRSLCRSSRRPSWRCSARSCSRSPCTGASSAPSRSVSRAPWWWRWAGAGRARRGPGPGSRRPSRRRCSTPSRWCSCASAPSATSSSTS